MKKTLKSISGTILITLLSAFWICVLPHMITTVYADTVVNGFYALSDAINNASTDPGNPTVIVLGDDIYAENALADVPAGKYVKLNLGGYHLHTKGLDVNGNLTITGSGELTGEDNDHPTIVIKSNGRCTL